MSQDEQVRQGNHATANHPAELAARQYKRDAEMEVERLRRLMAQLIEAVPQTWGEAVERYDFLSAFCQPHEWDNRTTVENVVWLIGVLARVAAPAVRYVGVIKGLPYIDKMYGESYLRERDIALTVLVKVVTEG